MNYAQLLFPDFALILCGYLVCRYTKLNRTVWEQVEQLVYFFLFPVLLFHSIVRRPLDLAASSDLILATIVMILGLVLLSFALVRLPGIAARDHAAAAQVAFRFNSFVALAVSERLGGVAGLQIMALLMGIAVPICNVAAVWMMTRGTGQKLWRAMVTNPLVLATLSGLVAVLASRMGYNGAYVAALVTASTLLALFSLPFALGVLR